MDTGEAAYLVLDSDCICVAPLDDMFGDIQRHRVLTYVADELLLGTPMNGLTREEMGKLFEEMGHLGLQSSPYYYGGEFFGAMGEAIREMAPISENVWQQCLLRHANKQMKFNEEAHLLTFLYYTMGIAPGTANAYIKRLWTSLRWHNGRPEDSSLPILHLPSEKRLGYIKLGSLVFDESSWFWTLPVGDTWRKRLFEIVGVPRPSPLKMFREIVTYGMDRIHSVRDIARGQK